MTDIVKGLVKVYYDTPPSFGKEPSADKAMRAALMWFAGTHSEEIAERVARYVYQIPKDECVPSPMMDSITDEIAAAIRAAAGEEGK